MKKCQFCAEDIQDEAIKCRYCGEYLTLSSKNAEQHLPGQDQSARAEQLVKHSQDQSKEFRQRQSLVISLLSLLIFPALVIITMKAYGGLGLILSTVFLLLIIYLLYKAPSSLYGFIRNPTGELVKDRSPSQFSSTHLLAWLLIGGGLIFGTLAYNSDTSVKVPDTLGIGVSRVNNIGLMQERQNNLMISSVIALGGIILLAIAANKS